MLHNEMVMFCQHQGKGNTGRKWSSGRPKSRLLKLVLGLAIIVIAIQLFLFSIQPMTIMNMVSDVNTCFLKRMTTVSTQVTGACESDRKFNMAFMKIHKTGSSTVQNIFLRYANAYNLTVLMPFAYSNYFGNPAYFNRTWVPKLKKGYQYNIFCFHTRWHYEELRSQMPNDTVFITVLREPTRLFESMYVYYDLKDVFNNASLIEYALSKNKSLRHNERKYGRYGRNQMSFDLGMQVKDFANNRAVDNFITNIDRQFHFVMIAEMMEESLVLLRQLLCWDLDEVVVFHHNVRVKTQSLLSNQTIKNGLSKWNNVDRKLYDHFLAKLRMRVIDFGENEMDSQVKELKSRTKQWMDYCVVDVKAAKYLKHAQRPYHPNTYGYVLKDNVTNSTCEALTMAELPFMEQLKTKQQNQYAELVNISMSTLKLKRKRRNF